MAISVLRTLERSMVMRRCVSTLLGKRVTDVTWNRTAGAVVTAVLDPPLQRRDRRLPGVVLDGRRLRDWFASTAPTPGRLTKTRSTTAFSDA